MRKTGDELTLISITRPIKASRFLAGNHAVKDLAFIAGQVSTAIRQFD